MNSNNRTALAVAATAGIAAIALLAVLRADSARRTNRESRLADSSARQQLDRWDGEGGSIPEVAAGRVEASGKAPGKAAGRSRKAVSTTARAVNGARRA